MRPMLKSAPMPLPVSEVERELTHTRRVRYEGYKRADGLWDIEAHLAEMLAGLPTAAIQTFAGEMKEELDDGTKPFQLDHCHALESTTETVKRWYPKWYRGKAA